MRRIFGRFCDLLAGRQGSVAVWTALSLPLMLGSAILAVDFGYLTLQKRDLQSAADLAAISAVSNIKDIEKQLLDYFALNGRRFGISTASGVKVAELKQTQSGTVTVVTTLSASDKAGLNSLEGIATYTVGRYQSDPAKEVSQRFAPNAASADAVKVMLTRKADLALAANFMDSPQIGAEGVAFTQQLASFSIGSRLASLDGGILNAILGGLLGTSLSLSVMDYEQLAKVDLDLLSFLDLVNTRLDLKAASYSDVLEADIGLGTLFNLMGQTNGVGGAASGILNTIGKTLTKTRLSVQLEKILTLGPLAEKPIGTVNAPTAKVSLYDILSAAAVVANGGKQVGVDLGATVPGLAAVSLTIAIGEPPVGTPSIGVGAPGSILRTAQTRIRLNVSVNGLAAIAGLKLSVPLYVEVANAEAQLADINCQGTGANNAIVKVNAVPGVAAVAIGSVDPSAFINFGKSPFVNRATLIDSLLLSVRAKALATAANLSKTSVSFSPADIQSGRTRSLSTSDTLTSLTRSLLKNLDLQVNVLFISLGTPKEVTAALADTLSLLTAPIDKLLYNLLLTLGVKIGEVDLRVTGASCQQPVLVQ